VRFLEHFLRKLRYSAISDALGHAMLNAGGFVVKTAGNTFGAKGTQCGRIWKIVDLNMIARSLMIPGKFCADAVVIAAKSIRSRQRARVL